MNRKLVLLLVCSLLFSSSFAKLEDWEVYVPIRKCGAKLIQYIMDENLCNPDKCEGKKPTFPRFRRALPAPDVSKECCNNACTPHRIAEICCSLN
ncbi:hypothetical protein PRIPAC_95321 [Pristionchus pacificus]|uniref:Uncharacterized protein n=1 Tax=Pristionchus pacificus TaxID=54126 RepID=A0A2A6BD88_PRIPA|nr:hypothetical protein PRIPAC_95321 [Pristionchus pacificus]|eukprot:PDM63806.1 hypothetical protein PRIPAC_49779 [Pristionchus pacificus]